MVATIHTVTFEGMRALTIEVQAQLIPGQPVFVVVGLPDKAVSEARERVRSALQAMGLSLPPQRIVVNLAPADVNKEGSHFDLPIALAVLVAMGVIPQDALSGFAAMGELGLDGSIRPVAGILPATLHAHDNHLGLICPAACGAEAAWIEAANIIAPGTLLELINHCKGTQILSPPQPPVYDHIPQNLLDMADVKGQETAKRALEIAAAGGHNLLMMGPPGAGKSMLAARLPGILPPLSPMEALDVSMVHSLAGQLPDGQIVRHRPYRDPHHSASLPALIGGGVKPKPGEVSLSHHGVLFLDELPEFARGTLEALRQPLESGSALIARANAHVTYPARFQLIAAMNPCRCGNVTDAGQYCSRGPRCAAEYQSKLSGPLLDRFDLFLEMPAVSIDDLQNAPRGEQSSRVAERVAQARLRQLARNDNKINAVLSGDKLEEACALDQAGKDLLAQAATKMKLSARGYHRVLRVARSIADLSGADRIGTNHLAEALAFRRRIVE
ncbi:MAG TPA: YifB family Mg chelatase-like AAA ATPase [Alphaproteobacteria bacterium]